MATNYTTEILRAQGARLPAQVNSLHVAVDALLEPADIRLNSGAGLVQNDVVPLIHVPASVLVVGVAVRCVAGNNPDELALLLDDLDVGDGADVDGWHDGLDCTAAVMAYTGGGSAFALAEAAPNTIVGYQAGKFYAAADTIDAKVITAATIVTGAIRVKALMIDLLGFTLPIGATNGK
jgi:hypothetical protein